MGPAAGHSNANPLAPRPPHFPAKARSVIFLYMDGGPSQVDTFDPKPRLDREHGQPIKVKTHPTQFNNVGNVLKLPLEVPATTARAASRSATCFRTSAAASTTWRSSGRWSRTSPSTPAPTTSCTPAAGLQGRPSHGAWVTYGLGSECQDLPGFVVLNGGLIPPGGLDCFNSGFLPAIVSRARSSSPAATPVANIAPHGADARAAASASSICCDSSTSGVLGRMGHHDSLEAAIANYELAFRMQIGRARADGPDRRIAGDQAALRPRRRLRADADLRAANACWPGGWSSAGVRFVELLCPNVGGDRWDQHGNLKDGHENNARAVDQPIAGLLKDLKARGLLDSTLVVWGGEFGRTPMAQGTDGRDHNPYGFTIWLAGGGIKGGTIYGATDDYGYHAVENKVEIHDLHATMLHLLGIDHKRLTYRFGGRDMRLTDVHGEVVHGILA